MKHEKVAPAQTWKKNIRALYESFQRTDEELSLLRDIDQAILARLDGQVNGEEGTDKGPPSVEDVFLNSMDRLASSYELREPGRCYVYVGEELLALAPPIGIEPQLRTPKVVEELARKRTNQVLLLSSDKEAYKDLFGQLDGVRTALIQPIYEAERLFAVLLFTDSEGEVNSRLGDSELRISINTVARQLAIAHSHYVRAGQEARSQELWNLFIDGKLSPTKCFKQLARMARDACPDFGPLRLDKKPEVQILVLELDQDQRPLFLTIRGTTGEEHVNTKIKIGDSISGLLIEEQPYERDYFCDDPRKDEYEDVYKSYLGEEAGTEIKTELAVRLVNAEGSLIGVLNLESGLENAFNLRHRLAILEFAERISRMVEVFEERIDHNRVMQLSVSSVTSNYLDSLAGIFRHGVTSPLVAFGGNVEGARTILDERIQPLLEAANGPGADPGQSEAALAGGFEKLSKSVDALGTVFRQVKEFTDNFGSEISGFGDSGRFDLRQLIEETVLLAQRSYLSKTEEKIAIVVPGTEPAYAFCTRLFKQHFFSLLTNAIHSLQESPAGPQGRRIEVRIEAYSDATEAQEKELNQSWLVRVRDNGGGVSQKTLEKLQKFEPGPGNHFRTGSSGLGLGLVAMQRYMGSLEGWMRINSVEGEFFEVRLLFDKYSESIHGPLSILSGGGGVGGS